MSADTTAVPWFHTSGGFSPGDIVQLSEDESRHARGAKRLREGDAICLFDGAGAVAPARIVSIERRGSAIAAEVLSVYTHQPHLPAISVASAVPKGDRLATLLSMAAQLGVVGLVPLQCTRSVAEGGNLLGPRGQRIIIEACKQARCAHAMMLAEPQPCAQAANDAAQRGDVVLLADPSGAPLRSALEGPSPESVTLMIGPEGGFTDDELDVARRAGAMFVSLGPTILRIETACITLTAAVRLWCGNE